MSPSKTLLNWADSPSATETSPVSAHPSDVRRAELTSLEENEFELRESYLANSGWKGPSNWKDHVVDYKLVSSDGGFLEIFRKFQYETSGRTTKVHRETLDMFQDFDWSNVVIGGGAISRLLGIPGSIKDNFDFDFYIYGLTPLQAKARLVKLLLHFLTLSKKMATDKRTHTNFANLKIVRSTTAITLIWGIGFRQCQICLTLARDPLELMLSFDIAPCKAVFDGKDILMTKSAKYAYDHRYYGVGKTTVDASGLFLAQRMLKYYNRNFTPVFLDDTLSTVDKIFGNSVYSDDSLLPKENKKDNIYNIVDGTEELTGEGDFESRIIKRYKENPCFIAMKYTPKSGDKYPLTPGWGSEIYHPRDIISFLDDAGKYWEYLQSAPKEAIYGFKDVKEIDEAWFDNHKTGWEGCPKPAVADSITFLTMKELFAILKKQRDETTA